jgi:hypothetical protein
LDIAKAVGWFKEGNLEALLSKGVRDFLSAASDSFQPDVDAMELAARQLSPDDPD